MPQPISMKVSTQCGCPAFKMLPNQAEDTCSGRWGWFLGHREGQDVQPQPGSLTSHLSYEGEETELLFPGCPRDTSKSTSEEELSSLQVRWELPGFWERGNPTGSRAALARVTHRGKRVLQNHPLRLRQLLPLPKPPPRVLSLKNTNKNHTTTTTTTQPSQPLTPFILQYTGII